MGQLRFLRPGTKAATALEDGLEGKKPQDVCGKSADNGLGIEIEKLYQAWRQHQVYRSALKHLDIQADHSISQIERRLDANRLFTFAIGTEAALSIGGALEYAHHGCDGIVNVFPFTCMPSTICSAILKPLLHQMKIPYLDAPYDGTIQPNREVALRTFLYQAKQHRASRVAGKRE